MPFSREYRPNAEEFAGEPAVPGVSVILLRRAFFCTLTTVPGTLPPASENYNEKINDSAYETKENAFIHALPARAAFPPGAAGTCCPGRCEPRCRGSSDFLLKGCSENSILVCKMLDDLKKKLQPPKQIAEK